MNRERKKAVVLLSGGIDSLVCAELARTHTGLVGCVFVDYGHPAQIAEGWKAFAYCGSRGIPLKAPHVRDMDLGHMGEQSGARVVPHRNAVLLAVAANAAHSMGADRLTIGCNEADQRDYPDCRRSFLDSMEAALGIEIASPLLAMSKAAIVQQAKRLGLTQRDAWSCYLAGPEPCGKCPSCTEADRAWAQ